MALNKLFSREYEVNFSHIDSRKSARPSFLFHIMQDAATVHAYSLRFSADDLHILWVLSRIRVTVSRPLKPYERVRCETWCPGVRGASWYRSFAVYSQEGKIGEASSMWVTLDPISHKILRPGALPSGDSFILRRNNTERLEPLPKLSCENVRPHHEHKVQYSDLDLNNHLNNVRIVDLISDTLDLQRQPGFVSSIQVNYTAETTCGENLMLSCGSAEGARFVSGEADGKIRFEALVKLSAISEGEGQ